LSISGKQTGNSLLLGGDKGRRPSNLLDRADHAPLSATLTTLQGSVDHLVGDFTKNATDWKTLASISVGGMAYNLAKAGVPVRGIAVGAGLVSEVSAFELTHRSLTSLRTPSENPNLWRLSGRGGLAQGFASSFVTFGTLKGFGRLAEGQNLLFQHGAQDTGMVLGHQMAYLAGVGPKPEGSVAEQYLQAEAFNLQLGAGMTLGKDFVPFHGLLPALPEDRLQSEGRFSSLFSPKEPLLMAATEGGRGSDHISMMSQGADGAGGTRRPSAPPLPPRDPLIGQIIGEGRYKVEKVIGTGGMGTVYACAHTKIPKKFALKVLKGDLARNPEIAQRFLDEAKAAPSIGNEHIIEVTDFGLLSDHSPYFIMEYLEGQPLDKVMAGDKPLALPRLIHIGRQLAEGLSAAHQKGIIHRDLKPGNIFLVQKGSVRDFVKILDFGIAKFEKADTELTMVGSVLGTPRYMSPEQAEGKKVDQRSDIYSLGVLLYKMASGKTPFTANDPIGLLKAHISEPPPSLLSLKPAPQEIPAGLDAIVLKCLAKNPAERYQSMDELMADLEKLSVGEVPQAESERSVRVLAPVPSSRPSKSDKTGSNATTLARRPPLAQTSAIIAFPAAPPPPSKIDPPKSRWPLILAVFGLGGAGALAVAYQTGKINLPHMPWDPSSPAPTPTAPPVSSPASPSSSPAAPSSSAPDPVSPAPSPSVPAKQVGSIGSSTSIVIPTPPGTDKKVEVTVDPVDAHVFRNGQHLGTSGLVIAVKEGTKVEIEIRREGFKTKKVVLDGSQAKTLVRLERDGKAVPHPRPPKENADAEEPPPPPPKYDEKFE